MIKKKLLTLVTTSFALFGCYDNQTGGDFAPNEMPAANMSLGELRTIYSGSPVTCSRDIVLSGYVTANDMSGNFFRTIVIQDNTGAIEIRAGLYDLKNLYPEGRYVVVKAKGTTITRFDNVFQIGLAPSAGSKLPEYFGSLHIMNKYVLRGACAPKVEAEIITAQSITDDMCGKLVTISGVYLTDPQGSLWAPEDSFTSNATRMFSDHAGNPLAVVTSKYASFAATTIPDGDLSITGILTKPQSGSFYALKIRSLQDVVQD